VGVGTGRWIGDGLASCGTAAVEVVVVVSVFTGVGAERVGVGGVSVGVAGVGAGDAAGDGLGEWVGALAGVEGLLPADAAAPGEADLLKSARPVGTEKLCDAVSFSSPNPEE